MRKQYHILNGDALKEQFPSTIEGEIIVARECLIEGNVSGDTLKEFMKSRAKFFIQTYGVSEKEYYETTASQFQDIQKIEQDDEINLWFEEDLFCQANLWFVISLINNNEKNQSVYLVRPKEECKYNFGMMQREELLVSFQRKVSIEPVDIKKISKLWTCSQQNDVDQMIRLAEKLSDKFPFIIEAVQAHRARLQKDGKPGRPMQTLTQIKEELNTSEFGPIFREFCQREPIYGYGDAQVKRMLDEIAGSS